MEAAFHTKLSTLQTGKEDAAVQDGAQAMPDGGTSSQAVPADAPAAHTATEQLNRADKSTLPFPEPRRIRDNEHPKFVAKQPCLICGRKPCDPHHLRFPQARALGRKASDEFTVPLCRGHHRELHRCGDEVAWWNKSGVDPMPAARMLWLKSHPTRDSAGFTRTRSPAGDNGMSLPLVRHSRAGKRGRNNETNPIAAEGERGTFPL